MLIQITVSKGCDLMTSLELIDQNTVYTVWLASDAVACDVMWAAGTRTITSTVSATSSSRSAAWPLRRGRGSTT